MSSRKTLLWLSIVLLVLVATIMLTKPLKTENDKIIEDQIYNITDYALSDIVAITIENENAKFAIMQSANGLEMITSKEGNYDIRELRSAFYAACNLTGSNKITNIDLFENYGFNAPRANLTLIDNEKNKHELLVLTDNPLDKNTYIYSEDEKSIFLISGEIAKLFLRSEEEFSYHTIFPLSTSEDFNSIQEIKMDFTNEIEDYTIIANDGYYYLSSPIKYRIPAIQLNTYLFNNLTALYADKIIATDDDITKYGFDKYTLSITVTINNKEYIALFAQKNNEWIMANPQSNTVYSINQDTVSSLFNTYIQLLGGNALYYSAGDVASIKANIDKKAISFEFTGSGESFKIKANSKNIEKTEAIEFIQVINNLKILGLDKEITGSKLFECTFELKSGLRETVELYSNDNESLTLKMNNKVVFDVDLESGMDLINRVLKYY